MDDKADIETASSGDASTTAGAARKALQMKQAAASAPRPGATHGRLGDERAAAARSAARSKPATRK